MSNRWDNIKNQLILKDPYMDSLINIYGECTLLNTSNDNINLFDSLVKSIISQQLSVIAANSIISKVKNKLGSAEFKPQDISKSSFKSLRDCGVSNSKSEYIKSLALMLNQNPYLLENLKTKEEDHVLETLLSIKGIGIWTAQMFQIFALKRLDVFASTDVGLLKGIKLTYLGGKNPSEEDLDHISCLWKPYRSIASWYMWRVADSKLLK